MRLSGALAREARELVAARLGLDLTGPREEDLARGVAALLGRSASEGAVGECLQRLRTLSEGSPEWRRLASRLTVGETYFFRDEAAFAALETRVLPELIRQRDREGHRRLRLWSAGCASGEEAYSLALLIERVLGGARSWSVVVLGSDIDTEALARARAGVYRKWSLRALPPWARGYFSETRRGFRLAGRIRRSVAFSPLNLASDVYPDPLTNTTAFDLVLCRNVLMYFRRETQRAVCARLTRSLVPGGWLATAPAEASNELLAPLTPVNLEGAILYRNAPPVRARREPAPSLSAPGRAIPSRPAAGPVGAVRRREGRAGAAASSPVALIEEARSLADRGQLEEARRVCAKAVAAERRRAEGHVLLASICQEQGDVAAALGALRRALYLAPDSAAAHFALGSLLVGRGQLERATRSVAAALELLEALPDEAPVAHAGGLTAGRLRSAARAYLDGHDA